MSWVSPRPKKGASATFKNLPNLSFSSKTPMQSSLEYKLYFATTEQIKPHRTEKAAKTKQTTATTITAEILRDASDRAPCFQALWSPNWFLAENSWFLRNPRNQANGYRSNDLDSLKAGWAFYSETSKATHRLKRSRLIFFQLLAIGKSEWHLYRCNEPTPIVLWCRTPADFCDAIK